MRLKKLATIILSGALTASAVFPALAATGYTDYEDPFTDAKTQTKFEITDPDDLNEENGGNGKLGGEVVVSVPAELVLGADANSNAILTKKDIVSARGRLRANQKLSITTPTSISYANGDDNTVTVPGVVAFGTTSGDNQLAEWSAAEMVKGVKEGEVGIVHKDISSTVQKEDIDYVGTYTTNLLYSIQVATK
jgi:hypothetical protein